MSSNQQQWIAGLILVGLNNVASLSMAATLPDSGSILRDLEQKAPQEPEFPTLDLQVQEKAPKAARADEQTKFWLQSVRFIGNHTISEQQLQRLLQPMLGKEQTLADLEAAAERVTHFYRGQGYLVARAYVPVQEIKNGVVTLAILEGQYGRFYLKNNSRTIDSIFNNYLKSLHTNTSIRRSELERVALLMRDSSLNQEIHLALQPGKVVGFSDIAVQVNEAPWYKAKVLVDNHGNRVTGRYRAGAALLLNNPLHIGDEIDIQALTSARGQDYFHLNYDFSLGSSGFRLGSGYVKSYYSAGEEFSAMNAYGHAGVWSINTRYPVIRSSTLNIFTNIQYEHKALKDRVDSISSASDKNIHLVSLQLSGDWYSRLGNGTGVYTFKVNQGNLIFKTPLALQIDAMTNRTKGHYTKYNMMLTHYQPLPLNNLLYISLQGQRAAKRLDPVEKFSLGGPYAVRAYPAGEASGDDGYLATLELRHLLAREFAIGKIQLFGFFDTGKISISHGLSTEGNKRRLSGLGLGATLVKVDNFDISATWSWKVDNGHALTDTNDSSRGWLKFSKSF